MTDNVRKIFDILDVEPNEKFEIDIYDGTFYFDQKLIIHDKYDYPTGLSLQSFINGRYKIIKLPKEANKKKLRDITEEEFVKWVVKNCHRKNCNTCDNCLFKLVYCAIKTEKCWVRNKKLYSDEFLDQEIEVEE